MGRKAKTVPRIDAATSKGVPYVVDIDNNQTDWLEHKELMELPSLTMEQKGRVTQLELDGAHEPWWVRVMPYSIEAYNAAWAASSFTKPSFLMNKKKKELVAVRDQNTMGEAFTQECLRTQVTESHNYEGQERKFDETTGKIVFTGLVIKPTNGDELVSFILEHADKPEYAALEDIFTAMVNVSHLERGLGEALGSSFDSSSPETAPSGGAALDATAPAA